ncbi:MAG: hypothetical protein IKA84_01740 [Clostridia bacterium]|nr:hypothetical protein [Clostridia bacterium]
MENFNNDEVKKMLEMLKERAKSTSDKEEVTQATDNTVDSADDIKDLLKKQFSAEGETESESALDDYSFDEVEDFIPDEEETVEEEFEENSDEPESIEAELDEILTEASPEPYEDLADEPQNIEAELDEILTEAAPEPYEDLADEPESIEAELDEILTEASPEPYEDLVDEPIEIVEDAYEPETLVEELGEIPQEVEAPTAVFMAEEEPDSVMEEVLYPEDEVISEEPVDYDEVLEGQQGTVFNEFVEDLSGDLEDVVFEAEITDSHAPNKQYTIFEDWENLMKSKDFDAVEEDILPPDEEELAKSVDTTQKQRAQTDYFNPVVSNDDLDAVDIALMVALGGKSELNETVGFEKIRQAVEETEDMIAETLEDKKINGCYGEEYTSLAQNGRIRKKYHNDKLSLIIRTVLTAVFTAILIGYEIAGWAGREFSGAFNIAENPEFHVLAGFILLVLCIASSGNKLMRIFNDTLSFSSVSYMSGLVAFVLSMLHDALVLIQFDSYVTAGQTLHSVSAVLILLSLVYDLFDIFQQEGVFNIIATSDKKLVLEPYGKIQVEDEIDTGEMLEQDSYCISRVPNVKKYFERTQRPVSNNMMGKLIPLMVSFSISICVALLLLIVVKKIKFAVVILSFLITLLFLLICTAIFETETGFFIAYKLLKKNKTGIIGKSSIAEHGKCNIVYFDDFNVFSKKSVRTKGLKLYDNNEIYRILYHTQAVFSKVGGPLKGVFEFATTEMVHSKNVEIKEISKEGISAIVDGRTSVLIGTGAFMRSRYIHPSYTAADIKLEEKGEESIMFIALNGILGAKLYVTYQFSGEFEKLAKQLRARGINIGIRSADPNVNKKWANNYGKTKRMTISIVRPTLKELKPSDKSIESGIVSTKNVRALAEALMMCTKLDSFERILNGIRTVALVIMGILAFALILLSKANFLMTMIVLTIACGVCASAMALLSYFYIKH